VWVGGRKIILSASLYFSGNFRPALRAHCWPNLQVSLPISLCSVLPPYFFLFSLLSFGQYWERILALSLPISLCSVTVLRRSSVKVEAYGGNEQLVRPPQWKLSMPAVGGSCFGWKPKIYPKARGFQVCPSGFPSNFLSPIFWYQIRPI